MVVPSFGAPTQPHKKLEIYAGLWPKVAAFGGCEATINQKLATSVYIYDFIDEARPQWSLCEDTIPMFGVSNRAGQEMLKINKWRGINRPPINKPTHNNQTNLGGSNSGVIREEV